MSLMKSDVIIPIFDGVDYGDWKTRMYKLLEYKKCKEVINRERTAKDNIDEWRHMEVKTINLIYSAISNRQLEYISDLDTAREIMLKFDEMYNKQSTALQIVFRSEIESIKLENFEDVKSFFDAFEKGINNLKAPGATIKGAEKLNYMIIALPSSFSYIGDLIGYSTRKRENM